MREAAVHVRDEVLHGLMNFILFRTNNCVVFTEYYSDIAANVYEPKIRTSGSLVSSQ